MRSQAERTVETQLSLITDGGHVKRYHAVRTLTTETVAEHSYTVSWLASILSDGVPSVNLLMACLQHDITEAVTGDIPSPAKLALCIKPQVSILEDVTLRRRSHVNWSSKLTDDEKLILKTADICAGLLFCVHERQLGNTTIEETFENYHSYLGSLPAHSPTTQILANLIDNQWKEANGYQRILQTQR